MKSMRVTIACAVFIQRSLFTAKMVFDEFPESMAPSTAALHCTLALLVEAGLINVEGQQSGETLYSLTDDDEPRRRRPYPSFPHALCEATHANLIAGNCPWCRAGIINGQRGSYKDFPRPRIRPSRNRPDQK